MHRILWIIQGLLAAFFVLAGAAPKLLVPTEDLPLPIPLPGPLIRVIGLAELLGGLGLILPELLGIRPGLTSLAAAGLVLVTIGATVYNLAAGQPGGALFAALVGVLCAFVAHGRWRLAPRRRVMGRTTPEPVTSAGGSTGAQKL